MISSSCGHTDVTKALIQSGGNVNKNDQFGDTALDYAQQVKHDLFYYSIAVCMAQSEISQLEL